MAQDNSKLVYGGDLMLFIGSGTTKTPLAFSSTAELSVSMATQDVTSKDSGIFTEKIGGRLDWSMSTDGLLSYTVTGATNSIDAVFNLMIARQPINVVFASKTGVSPAWTVDAAAGKKSFTGKALITALKQSADKDSATYSISLEGTGDLVMA